MIFTDICAYFVVFKALSGMEVEDEQKIFFFEDNNLISLVLGTNIIVSRVKPFEMFFKMNHVSIKVIEESESKKLIISKIPSTTTMVVTPSIILSREINPFGMTEFITHKVQITFTTKSKSD